MRPPGSDVVKPPSKPPVNVEIKPAEKPDPSSVLIPVPQPNQIDEPTPEIIPDNSNP